MRTVIGSLTVTALLSAGLIAQSAAPSASFDLADIHVRPHSSNPNPQASGGVLRGGRYDIRNATMLDLITMAYGVGSPMVIGGPNWLNRNRFDIIAKAPDGTSSDKLQLMLQSLLADRFKLVVRKDVQPIPSYILAVNGTPKMKAGTAPAEPNRPACMPPQETPQTSTNIPFIALSCHGVTMPGFVQVLQGSSQGYLPVRLVDQTNLKGNWDFDIKWTARNQLSRAGSEGVMLPAALEGLGLKMTLDKAPADVVVVEKVNEKPTDNPSGVAQSLPAPPPAEFDVADIKLAAPDAQMSGRLQPGGRLDFQGVTMETLFNLAWDITDPDLLAGVPKWFTTTKYNLVAKASGITGGTPEAMNIDTDDLRIMLRALITDRFKLVTHVEDRPIEAYTLVVDGKAKLQPADPSNRTNWFNGPAPGAKDLRDANPALNRLVTIQNMTMAQFAEDVSAMATGYLKEPVVDATGLEGAWDFVLNFSGIAVMNAGRGGDGAGPLGASAPTGALSLFDAIQKQLGLKLEQRKRPFPVLVIDHIEERPTDN
jgi:uncharacterized protein (TIGR03435 family)